MGKYQVIYADPPWAYRVWSKKGNGRSAESHYPTMSIEEIADLPVKELADENCALFLWVTGQEPMQRFVFLQQKEVQNVIPNVCIRLL